MLEEDISPIEVKVRDGDVMGALKKLQKEIGKEGFKAEMERRQYYEKPSEKRRRKQKEAERRRKRQKEREKKRKKRRR